MALCEFQKRRGFHKVAIDADGNLTVEISIGPIALRRTRSRLADVSSIRFWSDSVKAGRYGWIGRSGMIISLRKNASWLSRWKPLPSVHYHPADEDAWLGFTSWDEFHTCLRQHTKVWTELHHNA